MEPITLRTAAEWAGARNAGIENAGALPDAAVTDITRNTRTLIPGALFVPLKGSKADGHTYIPAAEAAGACAALCSRDDVTAGIPLLRVPDTLAAAQKLAAEYRTMLGKPVIGVTGSAGKTTTAAMICCVLGNLSMELGRALEWDEETGKVKNDDEANALLARNYRAPWIHP